MTLDDGGFPPQTIERLPRYLRVLDSLHEAGAATTSSAQLAALAGVGSPQVRKDLSCLGSHGTRGVGYRVQELRGHISRTLGLAETQNVVVIGVGNLGRAVAQYGRLAARGFAVLALVDDDPRVIGQEVGGLRVEDVAALEGVVRREGVTMAILTTPAEVAQEAAEAAAAAGVRAILSFAPRSLRMPPGVTVRYVDVGGELQLLAFAMRHGDEAREPSAAPVGSAGVRQR